MDERFVDQAVDYVESFTGLRSPDSNRAHFRRTLLGQALAAGIPPERLAAELSFDAGLRQRFLNAVMIGETYFFREASQFRLLRDTLARRWAGAERKLRCWSVSCSTGEEAVSLAAVLDELKRGRGGPEYEVHASDINDTALECLRGGVFPRTSLRRDGREFHDTLLRRHVISEDETGLTLDPALLARISIHHLNFFRDPLDAIPDELDIVFFRNTLLYVALDKREFIVDRIVPKLREGGLLFLATSELPFVKRADLRLEKADHAYVLVRERADRARGSATLASAARGDGGGPEPLGSPGPGGANAQATTDAVLDFLNGGESALAGSRGGADADFARLVASLFAALGSGRRDEAADILGALEAASGPGVEPLARYCAGRFHASTDDSERARAEFELALQADGTFWPARFYLASHSAPSSRRKARREFERCLAAIEADTKSRGERFACLLEGFNSAYFRRMCVRWIQKLAEDGGRSCP
jgi:chemotaxis methyl-accepting protein methylase